MNAPTMIKHVKAWKVFDSRGSPSIEVGVITASGFGRAAAPSGASRGKWEVEQYPPGGVDEAVKIVETVLPPKLIGADANNQEAVDKILHEADTSPKFSNMGGNTAYAVSAATALAAADSKGIPLFEHLAGSSGTEVPLPLGNVIGGGRHVRSGGTDIQEFLVLPVGARLFAEAAAANSRVHSEIPKLLEERGRSVAGKGDEGAWIADLTTEEAFGMVSKACEKVSALTGMEMGIGADVAASTLWDDKAKVYVYGKDGKRLDEEEQFEHMQDLTDRYDLVYLEDPFHEESFESFAKLTKNVRDTLICGDDLFATNLTRFEKGRKMNAGNAIIIKPNQVGTVTDAFKTAQTAALAGYVTVTSHRSGDVAATELAHFAIAFGTPVIKTGVVGGERVAKINELARIEKDLDGRVRLAKIRERVSAIGD